MFYIKSKYENNDNDIFLQLASRKIFQIEVKERHRRKFHFTVRGREVGVFEQGNKQKNFFWQHG